MVWSAFLTLLDITVIVRLQGTHALRTRHQPPAGSLPVLPVKGPPPPAKPPKPPKPSEGGGGGGGGGQPSDLGSGWPQLRAGEAPMLVIRQVRQQRGSVRSERRGGVRLESSMWPRGDNVYASHCEGMCAYNVYAFDCEGMCARVMSYSDIMRIW